MLQRIQSAYLSVVVLLSLALFFLPLSLIITTTDPGIENTSSYLLKLTSVTKQTNGIDQNMSTPFLLLILNVTTGLVGTICIFLFKNRKKQMQLCRILLILICLFIGAIFWTEGQYKNLSGGKITYLIGTYIPVIQLILVYLSDRAIKKDDDLVKSADRLR